MKDLGDKISDDKKAPIEQALDKLKEAHKAQDLSAIDTSMAELNTAFHAASEEMYAQSGQPGAQPEAGQAGPTDSGDDKNDNVQDADFEEVK